MRAESSKPLSAETIVSEALKLPIKNPNLLLPILLLSLLTSSILYLANYYTTYRLLHDLFTSIISASSPSPPINLEPLIIELAVLGSIFFIISIILSTFILITTITATSITHLTAQATLQDIFSRVKTSWKGPLITQLIVSGFTLAFTMIMCSQVVAYLLILMLLNVGMFIIIVLFGPGTLIMFLFFYVPRVIEWSFAAVVSVIEDECYGLAAISRVKVLIKGRRKQLTMIASVIVVVGGAMGGVLNALFGSSSMVGGLLTVVVIGVWNMVLMAAYTVFYYDCRRSWGEELMVSVNEGILYTGVHDGSNGRGDVV